MVSVLKGNGLKNIAKLVGLLLLGATLAAHALTDSQKAAIEERIKPVGELCIEGDDSCAVAVATSGGAPKSGEEIYNSSCTACHSTGAAGAPKLGDSAVWTSRLEKGLDAVYSNAVNGVNAMPAKGLCMSCSDDEIKATVDYMIKMSQ